MGGLKKRAPVQEKPKQLSFVEQLALQRQKLKKAEPVAKPPPEKKVNPRDLLSQQIQLRFQNLKMHEKEDENESGSEDSF